MGITRKQIRDIDGMNKDQLKRQRKSLDKVHHKEIIEYIDHKLNPKKRRGAKIWKI